MGLNKIYVPVTRAFDKINIHPVLYSFICLAVVASSTNLPRSLPSIVVRNRVEYDFVSSG